MLIKERDVGKLQIKLEYTKRTIMAWVNETIRDVDDAMPSRKCAEGRETLFLCIYSYCLVMTGQFTKMTDDFNELARDRTFPGSPTTNTTRD